MSDAAPTAPSGGPAYLIVLRHVLVAQDLALTIADFDPAARVIVAATPAEGLAALDGAPAVGVAFVSEAPQRYLGSPLAEAIASRGGRVVLIGEAAEAEGPSLGLAVLARPFGTPAVLAHLRGGAG